MRRPVLLSTAALRCASGANCASYLSLGEPSRLARGNPGPWCFACEKRSGDSKVEAVAAKLQVKAAKPGQVKKRSRSEGYEPEVNGALVIMERRRASVLTCERGLQSAIVSDDARHVRTWSKSLGDAEARLLWAEAELEACEKRA
jgi:hypothetical protein